ncbi:MAG TPA: M23 family metallopeptidase [Leptolyngbya sp.]|jgi:murein DD-endopeptidase MepM/ murein hydrolase activator NlpD|nr:M23 family metallopeptidase [Leptolyngbya sp.]
MTQPFSSSFLIRALVISGLGGLIGFSGVGRVQAQTPAPSTEPSLSLDSQSAPQSTIAPASGGEAFIDRTDYSLGATERSHPAAAISKPIAPIASPRYIARSESVSAAPIEVGGFKLSAAGINWDTVTPKPIESAYGTVQNYYNRSVRPIGRLGNGDFKLVFPLAIPAPITSLFGWRVHPITGNSSLHTGTDLGAPLGTPVLAALTGRVIMADFFGGYGLAVALEHNAGAQQTLYAHLSEIFVKPGEIVKQGTVVGRVGSTGNSTGPHLHFEVRQQTTEGWVAMDAGTVLETAMADLVKSMQVAQAPRR